MTTDFAKLAAIMEKVGGANDEIQGPRCWLDTGFEPLNHAISGSWDGGFPGGRIVEVFGPPSAGKTWLASQAMIAAQRMGGIAAFHDHERSFVTSVAVKMGLDDSKGKFFFKTPETFEQSIATFIQVVTAIRETKTLSMEKPLVWVFDSLASMVPKSKMAKEITELNMNDNTALSRATSSIFPAIAQIAEKYNVLVLVLNQVRTKIGVVYGDPTTSPGGEAPKFYASVRIQLSATRLMKDENGEKVMIGQDVTARCVKNKVSRPYVAAKWRFIFGEDGVGRFDVIHSLLDFAIQHKLLPTSGARVEWEGKTYFKSQLAEKIEKEGKKADLLKIITVSTVKPEVVLDVETSEEVEG